MGDVEAGNVSWIESPDSHTSKPIVPRNEDQGGYHDGRPEVFPLFGKIYLWIKAEEEREEDGGKVEEEIGVLFQGAKVFGCLSA